MGVQGFKVVRECLGPGDLVTWCHCEWSLGFWVCGVCGGWASGLVSLESLFVLGLGGMIGVVTTECTCQGASSVSGRYDGHGCHKQPLQT